MNQTHYQILNKMVIQFTPSNFQKWETLKALGINLLQIQNYEDKISNELNYKFLFLNDIKNLLLKNI
jgi:hypothetical protein